MSLSEVYQRGTNCQLLFISSDNSSVKSIIFPNSCKYCVTFKNKSMMQESVDPSHHGQMFQGRKSLIEVMLNGE